MCVNIENTVYVGVVRNKYVVIGLTVNVYWARLVINSYLIFFSLIIILNKNKSLQNVVNIPLF